MPDSHLPQPNDDKTPPDFWAGISSQMAQDQSKLPDHYDFEFISAYCDGELPRKTTECQQFEAQLFNNPLANTHIADIHDLCQALRCFGYRLEESCTLDITARVIAQYQQELAFWDDATRIDPSRVDLSAQLDQELTGKERLQITALIENDQAAKSYHQTLSALSRAMQASAARLAERAPDCWPAIKAQVASDLAAAKKASGGNLLFLRKPAFTVPLTAAAAIALLLVVNPMANNPSTTAQLSQQEVAYAPQAESRVMADAAGAGAPAEAEPAPLQKAKTPEVAAEKKDFFSKLVNTMAQKPSESKKSLASAHTIARADAQMDKAEGAPAPAAPAPNMLASVPAMAKAAFGASKPKNLPYDASEVSYQDQHAAREAALVPVGSGAVRMRGNVAQPVRASVSGRPSSEEYLIETLSEDMSNDEIRVLLEL